MKNVLISFRNDRGGEDRISTDHKIMEIDLFYKREDGAAGKVRLEITPYCNSVIVRSARNRAVSMALIGVPSCKLPKKNNKKESING